MFDPWTLNIYFLFTVIQSLEEVSKVLFKWFADNLMKSNADKCYLLVNTSDKVNIRIGNIDICNSKCEKLLGVNPLMHNVPNWSGTL